MALEGNEERAAEYWRRAVEKGPFDKFNSTYAGDRLVKKLGTSRPNAEPADEAESASAAKQAVLRQ